MSITSGHFTLMPQQRQFKQMLERYPQLESYWDFDKRECDIDRLHEALGSLSHGEAIMARFLAGVWLEENTLAFDMIDAAKSFDDAHLQVFINWSANPTFP